VTYYNTSI